MSSIDRPETRHEGVEADPGLASPTLDLLASAALIAVASAFMIASAALPVPGAIHTAPGLLPFAVAATLLIMALGLGVSALARRRRGVHRSILEGRDILTDLRSLLLACAVAVYIAALQVLAFQLNFAAFGTALRLSAFEPATVIALSTIIHIYWRGPLWISCAISVAWTANLSLVFQLVFRIPLPGSF